MGKENKEETAWSNARRTIMKVKNNIVIEVIAYSDDVLIFIRNACHCISFDK